MPDNDWKQLTPKDMPQNGLVVMTKIDDADGCRNEQRLFRRGRLWFVHDGSMYVYYTPTHWREMDDVIGGGL